MRLSGKNIDFQRKTQVISLKLAIMNIAREFAIVYPPS